MIKKLTVIILLLLTIDQLRAQHFNGRVIDKESGRFIVGATLTCRTSIAFADVAGRFILTGIHPGDTLNVSCVGYKPFHLVLRPARMDDSLIIQMEPLSILLRQVSIKASRDKRADSLRNRKEFASSFNYKGLGVKDVFINRATLVYTPPDNFTATNSTTQLVSIDLLSLIGLLGKNKSAETRLQKTLVHDEEAAYVDRQFSKLSVTEITALRGDSLQDFMASYRPGIQQVKKMTSYDMALYIRKSYTEFLKTYHPGTSPFKK